MDSNDQEQKFIGKLLSIAMAEFQKKGMPRESPHIYNRFRCPADGSTMTQAIQEIQATACTSWDVDGRRVPAQANSPLLNKYRSGPKPRVHYEFIPISLFFPFLVFVTLGF